MAREREPVARDPLQSRLLRESLVDQLVRRLLVAASMSSLDRLIPEPRRRELDHIDLPVPPAEVWEAVRYGCRGQSPMTSALFALGLTSQRPDAREPGLRLEQVASLIERPGFQLLVDDPPHEVIIGAIGKVEQRDRDVPDVAGAEDFAAFDERGWIKVAWALRVAPLGDHDSRLELELRVDTTDDDSWRELEACNLEPGPDGRPYHGWRAIVERIEGAARIAADYLRPRYARSHWGLDEALAARRYPGDDLVPEPRWGWTHAVEIAAPVDAVWPWVAQISADRGRAPIRPQWQLHDHAGLLLHPKLPPLRITALEPDRYFVAHAGPSDATRPWVAASWLVFVEPIDDTRCRLISRYRLATSSDLRTRASYSAFLLEPLGFEMDRRMLLDIKQRAERCVPAVVPASHLEGVS